MGRFRLCLHDYQRIRQADLKLDGLTVLCGVNGCGKSTLLRSLYYTVLGLKHYKAETLENYKGFLIELLLVKYDLKALFPAQASEDAQASALKTDNYPEFISTALHKLQPNFRTETYSELLRLV